MTEIAVFAMGCFWKPQYMFDQLAGVRATRVGYAGGHIDNPSYRQVCTDTTGHAEVVEITFDPAQLTFDQLLEVFWKTHDPTQVNRQGPDIGIQYRSAIFPQSEAQRQAAEAGLKNERISGRHSRPIATRVEDMGVFWPAEDYHQHYYQKKNVAPSCGI